MRIGGQAQDRAVEIAMLDAQFDQLPGDVGLLVAQGLQPADEFARSLNRARALRESGGAVERQGNSPYNSRPRAPL